MVSLASSDKESTRTRWLEFNSARDMNNPRFEEEMLFATTSDLKKATKKCGIVNKVIVPIRNNKDRVNAECTNCNGWLLRASLNKKLNAIQMKQYKKLHICGKKIAHQIHHAEMVG